VRPCPPGRTAIRLSEPLFFVTLFVLALALTLAVELLVAWLFRVGPRGIAAVALINLLTNPLFNLTLMAFVFTAGFGGSYAIRHYARWTLAVLVALEVLVVFVEWRLLVWVSHGTMGSSRRLFALSVVANAASAIAPFAVYALFGLAAG